MCDRDIELYEENSRLLLGGAGPSNSFVNNHQTTGFLSDSKSIASTNHGISKDCAIRYDRSAGKQIAFGERKVPRYGQLRSNMTQGSSHRKCAFIIGVIYSVFSVAVSAACLGYRYDVVNDSYGFRALLEGTAILSTVCFIASLGLIFGVIENRRSFVAAWLVLQVVVPLYTTVFYGWAIFASGIHDDFGPVRTGVPYVAMIAALNIGIMIACTLIINSYYSFLKLRDSLRRNIGVDSI